MTQNELESVGGEKQPQIFRLRTLQKTRPAPLKMTTLFLMGTFDVNVDTNPGDGTLGVDWKSGPNFS